MMIQVDPRRGGGGRAAPAAALPQGYLVCLAGNDAGRVFRLQDQTTLIGRGLNCSVILNDPSVSRQHFNILRAPDGFKLIDLGSGNGTRADGVKIQELMLQDGTQIDVGITSLRFKVGEPPAGGGAVAPQVREPAPAPAPPTPIVPRQPSPSEAAYQPRPVAAPRLPPEPAAPEPEMKVVTPYAQAPEEEEYEASSGGGGKKVALIAVIALVLGGGGFVAGDKFAGWGILFDKKDAAAETETKAEGEGGGGDAKALLAEAEELMEAKEWDAALKKLKEADAAEADLPDVKKAMRTARAERDAYEDFTSAMDAAEQKEMKEARRLLRLVPDDSVYFADAQTLLKKLEAAGGDEEAGAAPVAKPVTEVGGVDLKAPLALFDGGKFDEAAKAYKAAAEKAAAGDAKDGIQALADAVKPFADAYKAGKTALDAKKYGDAVTQLEKAYSLNRTMGGKYEPELKEKLAAALVGRGVAGLEKKGGGTFDEDITEAVKLSKAAVDQLLGAGRESFGRNNVATKRIFEKIQSVVPKDDTRREEAKGMLEALKEMESESGD